MKTSCDKFPTLPVRVDLIRVSQIHYLAWMRWSKPRDLTWFEINSFVYPMTLFIPLNILSTLLITLVCTNSNGFKLNIMDSIQIWVDPKFDLNRIHLYLLNMNSMDYFIYLPKKDFPTIGAASTIAFFADSNFFSISIKPKPNWTITHKQEEKQ